MAHKADLHRGKSVNVAADWRGVLPLTDSKLHDSDDDIPPPPSGVCRALLLWSVASPWSGHHGLGYVVMLLCTSVGLG